MKKLILILFLFYSQYLVANMASPIIPGTMMATPFTSQYVDILGEKIFIKINEGFTTARFHIEYRIKSSANGMQIPLIFYAMDYSSEFKVWIDGKELVIKKLPSELQLNDSILLSDFKYIFSKESQSENSQLNINEDLKTDFYININDLLFFETDITEGEHIIKVEYEALAEIDGSDWVNKYSFRYSLSPAKYWKSFGTLALKVDASAFSGSITTNLKQPNNGDLDSVSTWNFSKLPDDFILIKHTPEITSFAQTLINISPEGIALIIALICIVIHLFIIISYRNRNLNKKFSLPMIVGSLAIPLIYVLTNYYAYFFIDSFIDGASGNHGYLFYSCFFILLYCHFIG
jgi:hypothetical protein